jgi:hypothetical protein
VRLEFRNVTINKGRIYVELEQGRNVDVTGGLADPAAAIDLMMASEKMRQIAERNAGLREFADECREDAIRGARI